MPEIEDTENAPGADVKMPEFGRTDSIGSTEDQSQSPKGKRASRSSVRLNRSNSRLSRSSSHLSLTSLEDADDVAPKPRTSVSRASVTLSDALIQQHEIRMETTTVSGSFFKYVGLLSASLLACASCAFPLLFLPITSPDEGILRNWVYYVGYNSGVALVYTLGSWQRTASLCCRSYESESGKPQMEEVNVSLRDPAVLKWLLVATLSSMTCFALISLPFQLIDPRLIKASYMMLYTAPVACGIVDVLFVQILPKEHRTPEMRMFCFNVSGTSGMPIVQCFIPVVVSSLLPTVSFLPKGLLQSIVPVLMFIGIGNFLNRWGKKHVESDLAKLELTGTYNDSAIPVLFEMMLAVNAMLLYPGAETWYMILGVTALDFYRRFVELKEIANAMHENQSYVMLEVQDTQELGELPKTKLAAENSALEDHQAALAKEHAAFQELKQAVNRIGFPWLGLTDEQKDTVKDFSIGMNEEAIEGITARAFVHMTTLTAPLLCMTILFIIGHWKNKAHYYLFSCLTDDQILTAIMYMGISWIIQLVLFVVDMLFLNVKGLDAVFLMTAHAYIDHHFSKIVWTLSFVGMLYTSCFFIKHDGISLLDRLTCET